MACQTVSERGVSIVATVHGDTIFSVIDNPELNIIMGGIETVQLGDKEARLQANRARHHGRNDRDDPFTKVRRESRYPPFFHVVVELHTWQNWTVYMRVDHTFVRKVLSGKPVQASDRILNVDAPAGSRVRVVSKTVVPPHVADRL